MYLVREANIKLSCTLPSERIKELTGQASKIRDSFMVIRASSYVYVAFKNGHVNVTGVKKFQSIFEALDVLVNLFPPPRPLIARWRVDNVLLSTRTGKSVDLRKIHNSVMQCDPDGFLISHMNNDLCPGLYIKSPDGTCIAFSTGSFILTGVKGLDGILAQTRRMSWILQQQREERNT